jgi:predicted RecB family endonuclease
MIEMAVLELLVTGLEKLDWEVRHRRDEEGSARPDLVCTDPNGKVYLIEVKGGEDPMHFATIAQVERDAHLLSEREDKTVTSVLLTSQEVRPKISQLADQVGVQVVEASGSDQEAAESVLERLQAAQ